MVILNDRIGERRMMNCGSYATIIKYRGATDLDVEFDDGTILKHKTWYCFLNGFLSNRKNIKIERLNECKMMHCGIKATIIKYVNSNDINIRFENGEIIEHTTYTLFKKGQILPPSSKKYKETRINEEKIMNCGLKAKIIRYGSSTDIDVLFETGEIIYNKTYRSFINGGILPGKYRTNRLGEMRIMNCGINATIIRYNGCSDIDVRLETGEVIKNTRYDYFKDGKITSKKSRVGESKMMNCGMVATIIRYGGSDDIDILFEDGKILYHRRYDSFQIGNIRHTSSAEIRDSRIGERRLMKNGMYAEIIKYAGLYNIDIKFEDGEIVYHRRYNNFLRGSITHPKDCSENLKIIRVGEKRMMNCGLEAEIIRYDTNNDIDIRFDDGYIAYHKNYQSFLNGNISYPFKKRIRDLEYKFVTKTNDGTYYLCKCKKCNMKDILSAKQMILHKNVCLHSL